MPPNSEEFFRNNKTLILQNTSSEGTHYGTDPSDLQLPTPYILAVLRKKGILKLVEMNRTVLLIQILVSLAKLTLKEKELQCLEFLS